MSEELQTKCFSPDQCSALILAGGHGKRLRSVISDRPKPLAPVLGKPFLFWQIKYLKGMGIRQIVVSAGYKAEQIKGFLEKLNFDGVDIQCVIEKEPLGTGGAISFAWRNSGFENPCWLILNGDSIAAIDLDKALKQLNSGNQGLITGVFKDDTSEYGTLIVDENNIICGFYEKKDGKGWINAGIYLLKSDIIKKFPAKPASLEKEIFPVLIENGEIFKLYYCGNHLLDIGTPASYARADNYLKHHFKELVCDDHQ